jgi:hypothetical protein
MARPSHEPATVAAVPRLTRGVAGMKKTFLAVLLSLIGAAVLVVDDRTAEAQCAALPYSLTNGQIADATQVMANLDALLSCINAGEFSSVNLTGPGGGIITMQNPSATANYNFNLPATAGNAGDLLTSGGGGSNPETWTPVGTSGHVLPFLDGNNSWSGTQSFGPVIGTVSTQTGTSYTLAPTDCGTTIVFTNSSAITVTTLNSVPVGCAIAIEQAGSGQVTIAAGSGATQESSHNFTKTFGQYAILGLFVDTNSGGSAADYIITGDGA